MAIITYWNDNTGKIGQTYSALAIATYMGIEHNYKILLISTEKDDQIARKAFGTNQRAKTLSFLTKNKPAMDIDSGIEGIVKLVKSNRLTPDVIPNYTKVIFKDRLEVITMPAEREESSYRALYENVEDILTNARKYYDIVFVDLNHGKEDEITNSILKMSDIVILNIEQKLSEMEKVQNIKDQKKLVDPKKVLTLINNYDRKSKYTAKNIGREIGDKKILTVPYCNLFSEAVQEGDAAELLLDLKAKGIELADGRTSFFLQELKRDAETIVYKMQELQMMI